MSLMRRIWKLKKSYNINKIKLNDVPAVIGNPVTAVFFLKPFLKAF